MCTGSAARAPSTVMRGGFACPFHGHPYGGNRRIGGGRKGAWGEPGTGAVIFRGRGRFRVPPSNNKLVYPPSPCAEWSWSDPDLALFAC